MVSEPVPAYSSPESSSSLHQTESSGRWRSLRHHASRHPKLWIAGLLGLGLLVAGVPLLRQGSGLSSTGADSKTETVAERVLPVETITVEPVTSYSVSRSFTGEIAALRSSSVGFERSGTLTAVLVDDGDRVNAGQALARIDIQNLQTQRQQLVAQRAQAEAQLSQLAEGARIEDINAARAAVRDLEEQLRLQNVQRSRRENLYNQGAISREQLDEFTFGAASLRARLDQANSNLQELLNGSRPQEIAAQRAVVQQLEAGIADLDVTISKSEITAPFAGIVAEKLVDEGTVVGAGQSVLRISESAAPEARVGVPVEMVEQLLIGEPVQVRSATSQYQAEVISILPEVDAVTRTQTVVLALDSGLLDQVTPGQTVQIDLTETIDSDGFWLPTSALTQGIRGLWNCFAVVPRQTEEAEENSEALAARSANFEIEAMAVEILHQDGDRVLVRGTLQAGDRIVADGTHRMVPGQPVDPLTVTSRF